MGTSIFHKFTSEQFPAVARQYLLKLLLLLLLLLLDFVVRMLWKPHGNKEIDINAAGNPLLASSQFHNIWGISTFIVIAHTRHTLFLSLSQIDYQYKLPNVTSKNSLYSDDSRSHTISTTAVPGSCSGEFRNSIDSITVAPQIVRSRRSIRHSHASIDFRQYIACHAPYLTTSSSAIDQITYLVCRPPSFIRKRVNLIPHQSIAPPRS
jgi:hypothetical protein